MTCTNHCCACADIPSLLILLSQIHRCQESKNYGWRTAKKNYVILRDSCICVRSAIQDYTPALIQCRSFWFPDTCGLVQNLVLPSVTREQRPAPPSVLPLLRELQVRHLSASFPPNYTNPSVFCLSSQDMPASPSTSFCPPLDVFKYLNIIFILWAQN